MEKIIVCTDVSKLDFKFIHSSITNSYWAKGRISEEAVINQKLNKNLNNFSKPIITIWGSHNDLMWRGKDTILQSRIKGAKNINILC